MKQCARCLYTDDHPLGITFDEKGVCSGCRIHEEKDKIGWDKRFKKLQSVVDKYRCHSGNNYDCIIPVSGARDSWFIVHIVRNILELNPLLVTYNKQYNTEHGNRNLAYLRTVFDADLISMTVSPESVKRITRATLRRFGSMYWHCISGQTVFPVQVATRMKIPLIIWGAHQGMEQVGMFSHLHEVEMTRKYRKEHDLMGFEAEELIDDFDHVHENHISPYKYPDERLLASVGVRGIYLNNYIRWDSKAQNELMINNYGFETNYQNRTFENYYDTDCFMYSDLHDYIKLLKHGYGKATDHACREIRHKRITRKEGIDLVIKYEDKLPCYKDIFLKWLGIPASGFDFVLDQHINEKFWHRSSDWKWERKNREYLVNPQDIEEACLTPVKNTIKFNITPNKRPDYQDDDFVLISKGWVSE